VQIGHIEVFVRDLRVARDFYIDILGCHPTEPDSDHVAWLTLGEQLLLLRPGEPRKTVERYDQTSLGFVLYTADLDETRAELEARGLVFEGTDGSPRCLTFTDPDGNWFQLVDLSEQ